jgi:hypothetical protein
MSQIFQLGIIMFPTGLRERIIVDTEALQRKHSETMARLLGKDESILHAKQPQ